MTSVAPELMTVEEFAAWLRRPVGTVRRKLHTIPGVIRESRECVRIHKPTYLAARLKGSR